MIDIHSHILPGIDDGVPSMAEALELAQSEAIGGTRRIFATPHVNTAEDIARAGELPGRVADLNDQIRRLGISIEVAPGAELHAGMEILAGIDAGLPLTLGIHGRYVLLDLPRASLPFFFSELLFELQTRKITPILAHPERTISFQKDPQELLAFLERGAACQVNAGSLRGMYGPAANETALLILGNRWAHFLASDAHRPGKHPILRTAFDRLTPDLPKAYLQTITNDSGLAVFEGRPLPTVTHNPNPKRRTGGFKAGLAHFFGRKR